MRVAIDVKSTLKEKVTGIGSYTLRLIKALSSIDSHNSYLLFSHSGSFNSKASFPLSDLPENFYLREKRLSGKLLFFLLNKGRLPLDYFLGEVDIFQSTESKYPHPKRAKLVYFLADVIPLVHPEFYEFQEVDSFRQQMRALLDKADGLITPSLSSQKDMAKFFPGFIKPVGVIPIGIEKEFRPLNGFNQNGFRRKYGLSKKIILSVGTLERRKNFEVLLKAFKEIREKGLNYQLVIIGDKIKGSEKILNLSRDLGISREVVFTGYIPKEDLVYFYNLAEVFVYPSVYEGYGLPPLEAMACGLPVIVSRSSSLPEVVGEGALFFEPSEASDLSSRIETLLVSPGLREALKNKGFKRAKELSLEKMGRETVAFYGEILRRGV